MDWDPIKQYGLLRDTVQGSFELNGWAPPISLRNFYLLLAATLT